MTTPPPTPEAVEAARHMDWQQIVFHQGTPCFDIDKTTGTFCGRAERWHGHLEAHDHRFVSLEDLLRRTVEPLQAEVDRLREQADAVCEWRYDEYYRDHDGGEVGLTDWPYSSQCGETHTAEHGPYCPACGRKVKIQPQTNEQP
jgi:hypothetical protein